MNVKELVTYSFEKNVGTTDRVFRIATGLGLAALGGYLGVPVWASVAMMTAGVAWLLTGVVSRCGLYYLIGYGTCPVRKRQPDEG